MLTVRTKSSSTPAASTTEPVLPSDVRGLGRSRCQHVAKWRAGSRRVEQPDRVVDRRRADVHVRLRRLQILVPGQFLNRPRWRPSHREMGIERVTEDKLRIIRAEQRRRELRSRPSARLFSYMLRSFVVGKQE